MTAITVLIVTCPAAAVASGTCAQLPLDQFSYNPKNVLLPGMYVRASVEQGMQPDAVLLPRQAVRHNERNEAQRAWVKEYFDTEVRPLLTPIGLDPAHPFPQVVNKSLNFIVSLNGKAASNGNNAAPVANAIAPTTRRNRSTWPRDHM